MSEDGSIVNQGMKIVLFLREQHIIGVFENRILREIFRSKRDKVTAVWEEYKLRIFICAHQTLLMHSNH
jgi:hypothetical protein